MSRATISKSVSKGKYDPHRAAEFKDRANERRREIMLKAMEREAIRDQADHEPRKLIIIDELIEYLNDRKRRPGEINYKDVIRIIVNAFGKIPNSKRQEFKRIEDELRRVNKEIEDYKRTIAESSRMLKTLAKVKGKLERERIHSDHYLHSNTTQAEVLTNDDKKLITDTLKSIANGVSLQKAIENLKQLRRRIKLQQHRKFLESRRLGFRMRSRKRKSSKRKASRKRSRKRRSAKRKTSRKRQDAKRKSSKRKASRKRSRKRRSSRKRCPAGCVKKKTSKRKSRKVKKS